MTSFLRLHEVGTTPNGGTHVAILSSCSTVFCSLRSRMDGPTKPIQGASDLFLDRKNWIFSDSRGTTVFDSQGNNRRHLEMFQTVVLHPDWILGEWNHNSDQEAWSRVPRQLSLLKRPDGELGNIRQVDDSESRQNAIYDQKLWYLEFPRQPAVIDLKSKGKTVRELPHCLKEVGASDISLTALSSGVLL